MADDGRDGFHIPFSGIVGVALIAATIVAQQVKLDSARLPQQEPRRAMERTWLQKVETRLWQDPMTVVARYRERERAARQQTEQLARQLGIAAAGGDAGMLPPDDRHEISHILRTPANEAVCTEGEQVRLLPVMVLGGQSEEDAEMRRRTRYAVLSGLMNAGYVPDNADAIGYAYVPPGARGEDAGRLPETIPFEWLKRTPPAKDGVPATVKTEWMLVLWLDQSYYYAEPLSRLRSLVAAVSPACKTLETRVLGPVDSGSLAEFVIDIRKEQSAKTPGRKIAPLEIVSASATAALTGAPSQYVLESASTQLYRVIGSDERLTAELITELRTRNLHQSRGGKKPLVIVVAEQDTGYGRDFIAQIEKTAGEFDVRPHSYLRQIDGGAAAPAAGRDTGAAAESGKAQADRYSRSHGSHHVDYLRRLVEAIHEDGEDIAAIAVFGNDVYDKLLVLRALKPAFPKALFLTTDLDARLLDSDESKWTRNLIVATNYTLTLGRDLQRGAAPFRDGYQTATYLAAFLMAGNCAGTMIRRHNDRAPWLEPPLMFEIGRTDTIPLRTVRKTTMAAADDGQNGVYDAPGPSAKLDFSHCDYTFFDRDEQPMGVIPAMAVQPALEQPTPPVRHIETFVALAGVLALGVPFMFRWADSRAVLPRRTARPLEARRLGFDVLAGALGLLGAWALAHDAPPQLVMWIGLVYGAMTAYGLSLLRNPRVRRQWRGYARFFFIAPAAYVLAATVLPAVQSNDEPFAWMEGISVWPTQLLRWTAALLALWSIWHIAALTRRNAAAIGRDFGLDRMPDEPGERTGMWRIWSDYVTHRERRVTATIAFTFGYLALASVLMYSIGTLPGVPVRGADNLRAVQLLLGFGIFLGVALLVAVAFAYRGFVMAILRPAIRQPLAFPGAREYEARHRLPDTRQAGGRGFIDLYLTTDLAAQRSCVLLHCIYFPFAVFALTLVARSPLFDMWDTPPGLAIVLLLPFVIVIACVVWLRYETTVFHDAVMEELGAELVRLRGTPGITDAHMWQLDRLYARAKSERRGSFQSLALQPLIRALLLPIGGLSGIEFLEHTLLR